MTQAKVRCLPGSARVCTKHSAILGIDSEIIEHNGAYAVVGEIGEGLPKVMVMAHFDVVL